jgi:hypothetical protein
VPPQFAFILFTIFSNISTNRQRYAEHEAQPSDFIKVHKTRHPRLGSNRPHASTWRVMTHLLTLHAASQAAARQHDPMVRH